MKESNENDQKKSREESMKWERESEAENEMIMKVMKENEESNQRRERRERKRIDENNNIMIYCQIIMKKYLIEANVDIGSEENKY